jgi:hypothetical protein
MPWRHPRGRWSCRQRQPEKEEDKWYRPATGPCPSAKGFVTSKTSPDVWWRPRGWRFASSFLRADVARLRAEHRGQAVQVHTRTRSRSSRACRHAYGPARKLQSAAGRGNEIPAARDSHAAHADPLLSRQSRMSPVPPPGLRWWLARSRSFRCHGAAIQSHRGKKAHNVSALPGRMVRERAGREGHKRPPTVHAAAPDRRVAGTHAVANPG